MHSSFGSCPLSGALLCFFLFSPAVGADLEVGPGKRFRRIEDASAAAKAGDTILVHPEADGKPYARTALLVRTPRLTFRAVKGPEGESVRIDGTGFEYSGAGSVPRAIFQFDPGADGCLIELFEYKHPLAVERRPDDGKPDVGAFEARR